MRQQGLFVKKLLSNSSYVFIIFLEWNLINSCLSKVSKSSLYYGIFDNTVSKKCLYL